MAASVLFCMVDRNVRTAMNEVRSIGSGWVFWFTGLPSSGKTTIATALLNRLRESGLAVYLLDGDELRKGLNEDLGFSPSDRKENLRRAREVAALLHEAGAIVISSFINPYHEDRMAARERFGDRYVEVYTSCPVDICASRDPKGHYARARSGSLPDFTGISAPYERPASPEVVLETSILSIEESVERIVYYVIERQYCG